MEILYSIKAGNASLNIIYDKMEYGLYSLFSSDERMEKYICENVETAFYDSICKQEDETFLLNIASTEDFSFFEWKHAKNLLQRQLGMFMPVIEKFMEDALTGTLK